ncbi:MAG: glycosyltransferase [Thermomicrobiales bacterium]
MRDVLPRSGTRPVSRTDRPALSGAWLTIAGGVVTLALVLTRHAPEIVIWSVAAITVLYTIMLGWRMLTTAVSLGNSTIRFTDAELEATAARSDLPSITVMIPIRKEHPDIIHQQAASFEDLAYPRNLLDIMVLVDEDDVTTLDLARTLMPAWVKIQAVPTAEPRTKPRVLNYGLQRTSSDLIGVWDGEDWPEPTQLLRVAAAFRKVPDSVVCVQGRLVFRHAEHNLLTRWASIAYHGNFTLFIPALARMNLPVPLGGTSNFIKSKALRSLEGWDSWNVTEDLDLGVRIARNGWGVRVIDTETLEESNPNLSNCIKQWSRWEKGKIQTWLAHMQHPVELWRDLGPVGFCTFQLVVGAPILGLLLNPIFLVTSGAYFATAVLGLMGWMPPFLVGPVASLRHGVEDLFPAPIIYLGAVCQIFGNLWFAYLAATGALVRRHHGLVPAALVCGIHWLLLSAAAYKGLWQILTHRAHHWELTRHGFLDGTTQPSMSERNY